MENVSAHERPTYLDLCERRLQATLDGGVESGAVLVQRGGLERRGPSPLAGCQRVPHFHQSVWEGEGGQLVTPSPMPRPLVLPVSIGLRLHIQYISLIPRLHSPAFY